MPDNRYAVLMATGFNGRGAMYGPAVGRGIVELLLDDGYTTIDFSRCTVKMKLERHTQCAQRQRWALGVTGHM